MKLRRSYIAKLANRNNDIKIAIWLFFWLLIFEGALRKWVLPGLATPLLLIRDPIALWIVLKSWYRGVMVANVYIVISVTVGIASIFTAILFGHGSFPVAIYGSRVWFLYFPLIFVIGSVFTYSDVLNLARKYMILSIPMTILIVIQFYSPQTAWVNRGVGGSEAGGGFSGALDFFRPPGTFSFATGVGCFYAGLASFVFYYWLESKGINRNLLICSTICLIVAIPVSIIRGLFFQVLITLLFMLLAALRKPQNIRRIIVAIAAGAFLILILSQLSFFQTAIEAFTVRFTTANETEGGLEGVIGNRYLGGLFYAFIKMADQPFWGYGSGIGTNVGAILAGRQNFYDVINGEVEWQRVIGELGGLFGTIIIGTRLALIFKMIMQSYKILIIGNSLPWMILPFCLLNLPQGQLGTPISLGFTTLMAGVLLASCNIQKKIKTSNKFN